MKGGEKEKAGTESMCLHQGDGVDHQHPGGGGDIGVGDAVMSYLCDSDIHYTKSC